LTLSAFGQGVDPLIGTWKLNLEKSTFTGIAPPKTMTATWAGEGQTLADPMTGSRNYDSNAFHGIGNSINGVRFKNGKAVEIAQAQLVPGKTYTVIEEGISTNGQPYRVVRIYERQ
jgi:hypothetical protein